MNIKNLDKSLMKKLGIILGIIIGAFLVIIIFKLIFGGRISYSQIENKMIQSAKKYYNDNPEKLPSVDKSIVTINASQLTEEKYLKELNKLTKDRSATCTGQVDVINNNGYYLYSPTLNCGETYQTKKLKDVLMKDVVTSSNGLYNYSDYYIYRGEYVNNHVRFAGKDWVILRVNNDGTIRLLELTKRNSVVWDDRYNSDRESTVGINDYNVSRIKDTMNEIYNDKEEFSDTDKAYISTQNLCIGRRSSENATGLDGTLECSNTMSGQPLGLIQANEFSIISLDPKCSNIDDMECTNYNYLSNLNTYWTITADADNTYKVFKNSGSTFSTTASSTAIPRVVVQIDSHANYLSGTGTEDDPYIIQ